MNKTELEKVTEKIRKLLAKSESAKETGSIQEAEIFALKAQELLLQYNLTHHDINKPEESPIIMETVCLNDFEKIPKTEGDWILSLFVELSRYNLCKSIIIGNRGDNRLYIFGERHNIDIVKYLHDQLRVKIKRLSLEAWKEYKGLEKRNTFLRGYKKGVVMGIKTKLHEQQQAQMAKYEGMPGLVRVNNQAIDNKVATELGPLGRSKGRTLSGQEGRSRGFKDGYNMNINKGISNQARSSQKLLN